MLYIRDIILITSKDGAKSSLAHSAESAPMADGFYTTSVYMRRNKLSVSGEMIYLLSVLKPIRHIYSVTSSTDTLNRGITKCEEIKNIDNK